MNSPSQQTLPYLPFRCSLYLGRFILSHQQPKHIVPMYTCHLCHEQRERNVRLPSQSSHCFRSTYTSDYLQSASSHNSTTMQPGNSQQGDSPPSGNRSSSFNLFIKKAFAGAKKEKSSDLNSATPEGESSAGASAGTGTAAAQRVPKPHRNYALTEADLNNNVTALQTALTDAWPRRHHSRYKSGRALLVCWADGSCASASATASLNTRIQSVAINPSLASMRFSARSNDAAPYRATPRPIRMSSSNSIRQDANQGPFIFPVPYRVTPGPIKMSSSNSIRQDANQTPFISAARQLATVLERRYGIQSQVWMIPSLDNPQDMLVGKVKQFIDEYGGPDNLLVFWYGLYVASLFLCISFLSSLTTSCPVTLISPDRSLDKYTELRAA